MWFSRSPTCEGAHNLVQLEASQSCSGWTTRRGSALRETAGDDKHLCSSIIIVMTLRSWSGKPRHFPTLVTHAGVACATKVESQVHSDGSTFAFKAAAHVTSVGTMDATSVMTAMTKGFGPNLFNCHSIPHVYSSLYSKRLLDFAQSRSAGGAYGLIHVMGCELSDLAKQTDNADSNM